MVITLRPRYPTFGKVKSSLKMDRKLAFANRLAFDCQETESKGAQLRSLQDPLIDTSIPNGKLIFGILAVLAEYERELIRWITLDGLAVARHRGKHLGRKKR